MTACSASGDTITCSPDDRNGTYLFQYETRSGNCGDISDELVRAGEPGASNCEQTFAQYSEGDCKLEVSFECSVPGSAPSSVNTIRATVITRQETDDGSVLAGLYSVSVSGWDECAGTYGLTATRQ